MEADDFFGGNYRGRVITVHSNLKGEEKDDTVEQLLTVENSDNPTEIVVHVNMLKEPGTLLWPRLPSGGSQCPGSGTQVAVSRHLGWP
jgi:hypothetical protein